MCKKTFWSSSYTLCNGIKIKPIERWYYDGGYIYIYIYHKKNAIKMLFYSAEYHKNVFAQNHLWG